MRTYSNRLGLGHALLLVVTVAYTTSAALADDEKARAPQLDHEQDPSTRPTVGPAPTAQTQTRSHEPELARPVPSSPKSAVNREITRTTMDKPLVDTYLRTWPEHAAKAAKATIAAYGLPNEATPTMFLWRENGPWLRTVVYKDEVVHDFPRTHYDVIENVVQLKVPMNKVNDIVAFEGSAIVSRTEGLVAVRTNNEAMSYLAMNLISDIASGKKSTLQARKTYARGVVDIARGEPPAGATKLLFTPSDDRAQDPDKPMLRNDYAEPGEKDVPEPAVAPPAPPMPGPDDLRPGARPNDLNKPAAPRPTPGKLSPTPQPVPGPKNSPGTAINR